MAYDNLKKKLIKGDRQTIAKEAGCSERTVDDALAGLRGEKRQKALAAAAQLIKKREEFENSLS